MFMLEDCGWIGNKEIVEKKLILHHVGELASENKTQDFSLYIFLFYLGKFLV